VPEQRAGSRARLADYHSVQAEFDGPLEARELGLAADEQLGIGAGVEQGPTIQAESTRFHVTDDTDG
jgi:hypothetical protein